MASAFGHAFTAYALRSGFDKIATRKLLLLGIFCSVIPDIDVIGFYYNVPYDSFWGHRGFTHSILFAFMLALLLTILFFKNYLNTRTGFYCFLYLFICGFSHGVLDAMTSGGMGVAFFSPFENGRHFFPFRPIKVSPMHASKFFSAKGLKILASEFIWIGIPGVIFILVLKFTRSLRHK